MQPRQAGRRKGQLPNMLGAKIVDLSLNLNRTPKGDRLNGSLFVQSSFSTQLGFPCQDEAVVASMDVRPLCADERMPSLEGSEARPEQPISIALPKALPRWTLCTHARNPRNEACFESKDRSGNK